MKTKKTRRRRCAGRPHCPVVLHAGRGARGPGRRRPPHPGRQIRWWRRRGSAWRRASVDPAKAARDGGSVAGGERPGETTCRRRRRAPSLPRPQSSLSRPQSSASGLVAVTTILRERRCSSGRPIVRFAPRRRPLDAYIKK